MQPKFILLILQAFKKGNFVSQVVYSFIYWIFPEFTWLSYGLCIHFKQIDNYEIKTELFLVKTKALPRYLSLFFVLKFLWLVFKLSPFPFTPAACGDRGLLPSSARTA